MLIAASRLPAFKSGILSSAILVISSLEIVATFCLIELGEPDSSLQAFFKRTAAGGVFVMKEKDLSAYTVITTGMIRPASLAVLSLNYFVN